MGSCFLLFKHEMNAGERDFGPPCEHYFAKVQAGDYHGAYAGFSRVLRDRVSEDDFTVLDRGVHQRLGTLQSKTMNGVQAGANTRDGAWGRISYKAVFEKGPATVRFDLVKEGSEWKIAAVYHDSPLFKKTMLDGFKAEEAH
jgi:hypothetical protein